MRIRYTGLRESMPTHQQKHAECCTRALFPEHGQFQLAIGEKLQLPSTSGILKPPNSNMLCSSCFERAGHNHLDNYVTRNFS